MSHLTGKTIAFLATDGFEDSELTSPWQAVTEHGATARLVSTEAGTITGKNGHDATVDLTTAEARAEDFDGLVLPGGLVEELAEGEHEGQTTCAARARGDATHAL